MEESLKFNSQICTTIEQSKRLLDLGLKPETADMTMMPIMGEGYVVGNLSADSPVYPNNVVPMWSLHRLMEIAKMEHTAFLELDKAYDTCINLIATGIKFRTINHEYINNETDKRNCATGM